MTPSKITLNSYSFGATQAAFGITSPRDVASGLAISSPRDVASGQSSGIIAVLIGL